MPAQEQQTQVFTAAPEDVANILWVRNVDDTRLDPPPGGWKSGWVDGLSRSEMNVESTHDHQWLDTKVLNNASPGGEQTVQYLQLNNRPGAGWGAGLVVDVKEQPAQAGPVQLVGGATTTVAVEIDATGKVERGIDMISFEGTLDTAIKIAPGAGGHVQTGIEISADNPLVIHGAGNMPVIQMPDMHLGVWAVGGTDGFHLVGVKDLGTDHMTAGFIV